MLKLHAVSLLLCFAFAAIEGHSRRYRFLQPGSKFKDGQGLINHINSIPGNTWTAGHNFDPNMLVQTVLNTRMGLINFQAGNVADVPQQETNNKIGLEADKEINDELPETYDARDKYPKCVNLKAVKDQSNCGSCWAVSAASALSDRFCIQSGGKIAVNLSSNYFMSCSHENDGCKGGYLDLSWKFLQENGLITGGEFESDEGCQPYLIRSCGFPDTLPCSISNALTPKCKNEKCSNEYHYTDREDKKYKVSKFYKLSSNETEIRREIYKNGPVVAGFEVYEDFFYYQKGVYISRSWWYAGNHAVRVIGWGVEKGVKYWLVTNSWSTNWGDNGLFKIIRGVNECSFESYIFTGLPLIN